MRSSVLLILVLAILILATIYYGAHRSATNASNPEIAALRQEVAALRDEVAELRNANNQRKNAADLNGGFTAADGSPATPADIMAELKAIRAGQETARSELSSNLLEITLDRGSDAWARGDFKKAMKLLKPLAEAGQPVAAHRLGVMYVLGQGVDKDPAEAVKWYTRAAEQGQGESQHGLGLRYLWGDGTDKDPQQAAVWLTAAANQGIPDSATWLADMYWNGNGVQTDPVEAYKWMLLAGDKFNINHRNGVTMAQFAAQLTPEQLAEAQQRAKNFVPRRTGPEDF
ncbi:MAG: tetratricopeptide repeat protein [Verrucomicrobiae bacterium]|nr:tetratricopeptide repeat protein [Verrucomicrobiae bacterium]